MARGPQQAHQKHSSSRVVDHRDGGARVAAGIACAGLGLVHALIVWPRYRVGSFDDDASYVLAARALASGHGLTSRLAGGYPLIGVYPPGYAALLSPLAALWPSGVTPFRVLSLVLFVAIFPLAWIYLGRRQVPGRCRVAALALLALNPVLATYATMVMPETAFVVMLLVLLLAVDRWEREAATLTQAGLATIACAGGLLWLKEAGIGLVVGVVAWLVWRRLVRKAAILAMASAGLFLPVLVLRARAGAALIGSRYSGDLGTAFHGGLASRVVHLVPTAARAYVSQAIPRSILPTLGGFLPVDGPTGVVLKVLTGTAAALVLVGFIAWCRHHPDAACLAVPVYLAETLIYPFTNERRVVLILPLILVWYLLGAASVWAAARRLTKSGTWPGVRVAGVRVAGVAVPMIAGFVVLGALASQFTRDYLYFEGASSSAPAGSPYMALLRRLGGPQVVETDYLWTTALYTGHRTANGVYLAPCGRQAIVDAIAADHGAYVLTADLTAMGPVDSACLVPIVAALPGSVRLYRTDLDQASVFELVGPGTAHPGLADLTGQATLDGGGGAVTMLGETPQTPGDPAGSYPKVEATDGAATLTWSWRQPVSISQISLGAASAAGPATASVSVSVAVRSPDGTWRVVAGAPGPVGGGTATPFLLAAFPSPSGPVTVTAARVTVSGPGASAGAVHDFHVLGSSGT